VIAAGANAPSYVCLSPAIVLPPGSIGVALQHVDIQPWYTNTGASQTFSTAELTLSAGAVQGVPWTAPTGPRIWNGSIYYTVGTSPHECASNESYGSGCYQQETSFYQMFTTAPQADAALSGRSISMLAVGGGYNVLNNVPSVGYVTPPGTATAFAADDSEIVYTWPSGTPFAGAGGPTSFVVHSNGIVALASVAATLTPNQYRANVQAMLNSPVTAWWSWHDYNSAAAGSGLIKMHEAAGFVYVTWDNVESYPTATVNPSTLQFQFELASGNVHLVWPSITPLGLSVYGDSHVVGYSPGGQSFDPGPTDLTTFAALVLEASDMPPLSLSVSPRPALGATVSWTTTDPTSVGLGVNFVALSDLPPFSPAGFDLGVIGASGCVANIDLGQAVGELITNLGSPLPGMVVMRGIPTSAGLLGASLYAQSAWLDPAANPGGLITSNAVRSTIGSL
jgi:hypothetical protein